MNDPAAGPATPAAIPPVKDLTHRRIFRIALPIVLSNATVPLLGAVDTAVIGQLGQAAPLGAVGIGAVILATLYWAFGFLRMSTSGLAAQAHGAGDGAERSAVLIRALLVGGLAGLGLILLQGVLFRAAFALAPASDAVENLAQQYLAIRIWGAPATIALYALTGWLVALERTRGILILQLWQNGLNIGLDLWFVLGLGWGIAGVAGATLIAEWTGLGLGLYLVRDAFGARAILGPQSQAETEQAETEQAEIGQAEIGQAEIGQAGDGQAGDGQAEIGQAGGWRAVWRRLGDRAALARMFTASRDILGRTVILQASFTTFVLLGARSGDVTLAANQVLMQFLEITAYALDGFAFSAEALIGQAVGARSVAGVRRATRMCLQWGLGGAVLLALVFAGAGPGLIDVMTTAPEVRNGARVYLGWLVAAPLIGVAAWIYDGVFIGAMQTGAMLRAMLGAVAVYAVALGVLVPAFGNHGLWAALMVLNGARGILMARAYPGVLARAQ